MANKWVYAFDEVDQAQQAVGGDWDDVRALLGGKGANLGDMTRIRGRSIRHSVSRYGKGVQVLRSIGHLLRSIRSGGWFPTGV